MHFRVYVHRNCSWTINYLIIIEHDYYANNHSNITIVCTDIT